MNNDSLSHIDCSYFAINAVVKKLIKMQKMVKKTTKPIQAIRPVDDALIDSWLKNMDLLPTTQKQYESQVRKFADEFHTITVDNVVEFLRRGQGEARVYHRKYAIKNLLKYMRGRSWLSLTEFNRYMREIKDIHYKVRDRREINTILIDELEYLIKNLDNPELKLILMIEFDTASRIRAILKLRKKDVRDFQGKPALFLREKREKTQLKIITGETHTHLEKYLESVEKSYIFFDTDRVTSVMLDEKYYELWLELRRESRKILGKPISFHWIRRGAGVYWYDKQGKDIVFVQELLGHESPATTAKYLKIEGEKVREQMKKESRNW